MSIALLMDHRPSGVAPPVYLGFGAGQTGNPTIPTHEAGNLLVGFGPRASATPATVDTGGWSLWGAEPHGTTALSLAVYYKIAESGSETIAWTNSTSLRGVWVFENAVIDTLNFSQGNGTTTLDWEAQPTMTAGSLVGIGLVANAAQTATSAVAPAGFTQRANRNTSLAGWAGDSNATLLDSFDPANSTFDTATNWIAAVFSVKAA